MGGKHFLPKRKMTRWVRIATIVSLLLMLAGATILANIAFFYYHSSSQGAALIRRERATISEVRTASPTAQDTPSNCLPRQRGKVAGLLEIPAIKLVAPVVEGSRDLQLADAVGHNSSSSWPGGAGTTVLDGHDVTWFHDLPALDPGDSIVYTDPCHSISYTVTSKKVVSAGTPIYDRPGQLDLVTCYPLDALYLTNQRMVIEATQAGETANESPALSAPPAPNAPRADVPSQWQQLATLQANPVLLGTLQVDGQPNSVWTQSAAPLDSTANVQETYFAAIREAESVTSALWSSLHPAVPYAQVAALHGHWVTSNRASLETTITVHGISVTGATIVTRPTLDNGATPTVRATFSVQDDKFVLIALQAA